MSYDVVLTFRRAAPRGSLEALLEELLPGLQQNGAKTSYCWQREEGAFFTVEATTNLLGRVKRLSWNLAYGGTVAEAARFAAAIASVAERLEGVVFDPQAGGELTSPAEEIVAKWREANLWSLGNYESGRFEVRGARNLIRRDGRWVLFEAVGTPDRGANLASVWACYARAGELERADALAERIVAELPDDEDVLRLLAEGYRAQGELERTAQLLQAAAGAEPAERPAPVHAPGSPARLAQALDAEDYNVRADAAEALAALGAAGVAQLVAAIEEGSTRAAEAALAVLPEVEAELPGHLRDAIVRRIVSDDALDPLSATSLWDLDADEAFARLCAELALDRDDDEDAAFSVRERIAMLLSFREPVRAIPHLAAAIARFGDLDGGAWSIPDEVESSLAMIDHPDACGPLLALLDHPCPGVRRAAVTALGQPAFAGSPEAHAARARLAAEDPHPAVREAAARPGRPLTDD